MLNINRVFGRPNTGTVPPAGPAPHPLIVLIASALLVVPVAIGLGVVVDRAALAQALDRAVGDPFGPVLIAAALLAAFSLRAAAWSRMLPGIGFGQALAAVHVALGANHVLPLRLGEPLRVVSAVRRSPVGFAEATATAVVLRAGDVIALLLLGLLAGPGLVRSTLGWWGLVVTAMAAVVGVAAFLVVGRIGRLDRTGSVARPDLVTVASTAAAWLLEAVVVWRVAGWFGHQLGPSEAMVVLASAVGAQLLAVTPAGVGTYEAAATATLVTLGLAVDEALAVAVVIHGVKTIYSLIAGALAVAVPRPGLAGRLRLPADRSTVDRPESSPVQSPVVGTDAPVVLFLPARDEGPRVADVVAAAPPEIDGHPVEVLVVDDGSTDDTRSRAEAGGARVVSHPRGLGLGAAVRTGLAEGVVRGAVATAFCDADGEYDPADLAALVRPILDGRAHYVVGTRFGGRIERMHPHRRLGNRVLTRWIRFVVRQPVTDGQSGFRALSLAAATETEIAHDYNYAQVLTIDLVGRGFGYTEVPITYRFRRSGRSFIRLGPYLAAVVPTVWRQLNPIVSSRSARPDHRRESSPCPHPTEPRALTTS